MGTKDSFSAGKEAGAWSWPLPSSAEVKMRGAIPPLPQYAFMAWWSGKKKHGDNFTFTLNFNENATKEGTFVGYTQIFNFLQISNENFNN
jgi:hypothetical protein